MDQGTVVMIRNSFVALVISYILYKITATSTLFIIPLLFIAPRFPSTKTALIPIGIFGVWLIGSQLLSMGKVLYQNSLMGTFFIVLYLPLNLLIGSAIWILLKEYKSLHRLFFASVFAAISGLALVIWLSGESSSAVATEKVYREVVNATLPAMLGTQTPLGINSNSVFDAVVRVLKIAFFPLFVGQFGLSVLISEQMISRGDEKFQNRLAGFALNESYVWPFLISWTVVLFTLLIKVEILEVLAWNSALTLTLLYLVQGMAIISYLIRKKNPRINSTRVYILSALLMVMPGVNVVVLAALPILGVSQTWINLRK
jgi:hypothetical protein